MSFQDGDGRDIRASCIAAAILALILAFVIVARIEAAKRKEEPTGDLTGRFEEQRTITYNGKEYRMRNKLTSVLMMGIDTWSDRPMMNSGFRSGGQSDFLLLMVIDHDRKTVTPIQIDRDTMTEITVLGVLGNVAGTRTAQICLSHGFGNGGEQSALFTVDAVAKLLLGVPVDFYVAMQLDGIATLNDALGGVTVTLDDDFTALDPAMTKGSTLALRGKQAEYYTRHRMSIGVGTNASRMVRQRQYIQKVSEIFDAKIHENANYVGTLFDVLQPFMESSMRRGRMINEAANTSDYQRLPTVQLQGEHVTGKNGFVEFHADADALMQMVLNIYYQSV